MGIFFAGDGVAEVDGWGEFRYVEGFGGLWGCHVYCGKGVLLACRYLGFVLLNELRTLSSWGFLIYCCKGGPFVGKDCIFAEMCLGF